ncbi:DUF4232 domain-containing protein [Kutzneria buriramensis]|uniref:Uncharacterized protein DUF4232 n=1 Tax=Kutzneria buriramensis TaxID=1045776 RepID=A0A3E0I9E8_9PSEU|nr:DUF4232 domain-containing protein [Kutzneria buriramensis]REH55363.1 uncharacterized protein DUF4232 [Kutzneria buriramensis]
MRLPLITVALAGLLLTACGSPVVITSKTSTAGNTKPASSTAPPCRAADMKALPTIPTPPPAGTEAVRVELVNNGDFACTLTGIPKVAISDQPPADGSQPPRKAMSVRSNGKAVPFTLQPGDDAITVVASPETPDLKCASGAMPTKAAVVLVGVPDELVPAPMVYGTHFSECGDAVSVTPWQEFG